MASAAQLSIQLSQQGFGPVQGAFNALAGAMGGLGRAAGGIGGALGAVTSGLGKLGLAGMGIKIVAETVAGLGEALGVGLASDLAESTSKVQTILGDSSRAIFDFARTSSTSFGLSQAAAVDAAGGFANLLRTTGLTQQAAAGMSVDLVKLSADLASFHNISGSDAMEKLRSGLVGEAEPLRQLGILLSEAEVENEALRVGIIKTGQEMTEAQKVQARYSLIMRQSATAQGDFARTSTGLANSQRIISAAFDDIRTAIGQRLLPVITPLVSAFAQWLPTAMDRLGPLLDGVTAAVTTMAQDGWALIGPAVQRVMEVLPDLIGAFQQALSFFQTGQGDIEKFRGVLNAAFGPEITQGIIEVFTNLSGFLRSDVLPALQGLGAAARQAFGGDLQGALQTAGVTLGEFGQGLAASLTTWGQRFIDWVGPMIPPLLAELGKLGGQIIAWIAAQGPPLLAQLWEWNLQFIGWVAKAIPPLMVELGKLIGQLFGWITTQGAPLAAAFVAEWVPKFWRWIVNDAGPAVVKALGDLYASYNAWMAATGAALGDKLLNEWVPAWLDWLGDLLDQLPAKLNEVRDLIQSKVGEFAGALLEDAKALGKSIVDGTIKGVSDAAGSLTAELRRLGESALQAAKDAIWSQSPSRRFAQEVGDPMVRGIIQGLQAAGGDLSAAVETTMGRAADQARAQSLRLAQALGGEARAAVLGLIEQLDLANYALSELGDQMGVAEAAAAAMERALRPLETAAKAADAAVDRLKEQIRGLQTDLDSLGGGDVRLPGEGEADQTLFGLRNAINILKFQRLELLRSGARADDPRVKAIDEEIKRNEAELEYQEARKRAAYDGQRNALEQAARAGTEQVAGYEAQYARIVAIKAELATRNQQLADATAEQRRTNDALQAAKEALDAQRAVIDQLKADYEGLKLAAEQWKGILDNVLKTSKEITAELKRSRTQKDALDREVKGGGAGGQQTASASFSVQNTIDARGMTPRQLTAAVGDDLAALLRARVVSGAI